MKNLSEEEKKAIDILINEIAEIVVGEYCTHCKICENEDTECYYTKVIETVYKLILKQQKEIECLEKKNKRYEKIIERKDNKCEELLEFVEIEKETDFISKDKIKAKIEENKKLINECLMNDNKIFCKECTEKCGFNQIIDVLQSLLEEE